MCFAGSYDKIVRNGLLEHKPHRLNIFGSIAPVSFGVDVSDHDLFLPAMFDHRDPIGYLAGYELKAPEGGLVVEEYARGGEHIIRLSIVDAHPVPEQLGNAIGASWVKRRFFSLWMGLDLAEHLPGGRLIEFCVVFYGADSLKKPQNACGIYVGGKKRLFKG